MRAGLGGTVLSPDNGPVAGPAAEGSQPLCKHRGQRHLRFARAQVSSLTPRPPTSPASRPTAPLQPPWASAPRHAMGMVSCLAPSRAGDSRSCRRACWPRCPTSPVSCGLIPARLDFSPPSAPVLSRALHAARDAVAVSHRCQWRREKEPPQGRRRSHKQVIQEHR